MDRQAKTTLETAFLAEIPRLIKKVFVGAVFRY